MSKQSAVLSSAQRESEWRDRLARQAASRLSVKAFCQSESISTWAFYHWRSRLDKRGQRVVARNADRLAPTPFIDVSAVCAAEGSRGSDLALRRGAGFEIKLELGDGVVLHLARF